MLFSLANKHASVGLGEGYTDEDQVARREIGPFLCFSIVFIVSILIMFGIQL
jgi:hypothetical protein